MSEALLQNLKSRRLATDEFGASTLDEARVVPICRQCNRSSHCSRILIQDDDYDDPRSLRLYAQQLFRSAEADDLDYPCDTCSEKILEIELIYLSYHATEERDLAVRSPLAALSGSLEGRNVLVDPIQGFFEVGDLDSQQLLGFELTRLVRKAVIEGSNEDPKMDELAAEAKRVVAQAPGHPLLLEVMGTLTDFGRTSAALVIAKAHVEVHPQDPRGHAWFGEVLFILANHGHLEFEALGEVIGHLKRAVELDPSLVQTRVCMGNTLRLMGKNDEAREWFAALVEEDDTCPPARFNLGVMDLERGDAESALAHFTVGEQGDSEDPDFPMGRARALVALGRLQAAREALEQVRSMAPDHPRIEGHRISTGRDGELKAAWARRLGRLDVDPLQGSPAVL